MNKGEDAEAEHQEKEGEDEQVGTQEDENHVEQLTQKIEGLTFQKHSDTDSESDDFNQDAPTNRAGRRCRKKVKYRKKVVRCRKKIPRCQKPVTKCRAPVTRRRKPVTRRRKTTIQCRKPVTCGRRVVKWMPVIKPMPTFLPRQKDMKKKMKQLEESETETETETETESELESESETETDTDEEEEVCTGRLSDDETTTDEESMDDMSPEGEANKCRRIVQELMKYKFTRLFRDPVKPADLPDYHEIVKNPMWLRKILQKIDISQEESIVIQLHRLEDENSYNLWKLMDHIRLILDNAILYNPLDTYAMKQACRLEKAFVSLVCNSHMHEDHRDRLCELFQSACGK